MMKLTKLAIACSLAIATMAVEAAPGDVRAIPAMAAVPEANIIYFSGASAPDNFLQTVSQTMFQPGFTVVFGIGTNNYRAFIGTAAAGVPGVTAGTPIALIKRSQGGSVWGVNPVARAQNIQTMDIRSANCIEGASATQFTCPIVGTDPVGAGQGVGGRVTDFGVSDVEPALFKQPYNTENGAPQLTASELANLISLPLNQISMGIVATNAVSATTHLSRSQYGGALAGLVDTWNIIDGSQDAMVVCRRVDGSGTQSSYNWFFSGFPCNNASNGFAITPPAKADASFGYDGSRAGTTADPFIIDPSQGLTIVENSSSGDVRNCLSSAYYGVDHIHPGDSGKFYRVQFSNVAGTPVPATVVTAGAGAPALGARGGPSKAIGVLSFDSFGNANSAFGYRPLQANGTTPFTYTFTDTSAAPLSASGWTFRMLDGAGTFNGATQTTSAGATGVAPSKTNLVDGKYDFVVELTMQRRTNLSALKTSFFTELRRRLGAPANNSNVAFAALPDIASYVTNPTTVNKFSRGGNTCSPLVAFPPL